MRAQDDEYGLRRRAQAAGEKERSIEGGTNTPLAEVTADFFEQRRDGAAHLRRGPMTLR